MSMTETLIKIIECNNRLLDYFYSGVLSYIALKSFREEFEKNKETTDDIFIGTAVINLYNNAILSMANTIKPNDKSVNLDYLFNIIRYSESSFKPEIFNEIMEFIPHFEKNIEGLSPVTDMTIVLRDKSIAHLDRDHVNKPYIFFANPPIKWEEFENAFDVIGSGLSKIKEIIEGGMNFVDFASIANAQLSIETKRVYYLFYKKKVYK
jgi:hypothetical protein